MRGRRSSTSGRSTCPCNVGTYLDSPFHRYADRDDLSQVALDRVAGLPGIVLDAPITPRPVHPRYDGAVGAGGAVLIRTGWDARWGTPNYWELDRFSRPAFLDELIRSKPALVGVDFWNVDNTEDARAPRPHPPPWGGDPRRRTPDEPAGAPAEGVPLFRRAVAHCAGRVVPGSSLRRDLKSRRRRGSATSAHAELFEMVDEVGDVVLNQKPERHRLASANPARASRASPAERAR